MKLKWGRWTGGMGCKLSGFIVDECYDATIYGICFNNRGLFLIVPHDDGDLAAELSFYRVTI